MTADQSRLDAVRAAGGRRDYDFNNRKPYETRAEADAFEAGLRDSTAAAPVVETRFTVVRVTHLPVNKMLGLREGVPLLWCGLCRTVADEASCADLLVPDKLWCPKCGSDELAPFDDDLLDREFPWRECDWCGYGFLLDDALGGSEPGSYLCPKCGVTTF